MPIQPADPDLRRRTLLLVALALALACVGFFLLQHWIADLQARPPEEALPLLIDALRWAVLILCVLLGLLTVYLWTLGNRVTSDSRFPPHGQRVIRDTTVLEGDAAMRRGRVLRGLAMVLALCAVGLLATSWHLLSRLAELAG